MVSINQSTFAILAHFFSISRRTIIWPHSVLIVFVYFWRICDAIWFVSHPAPHKYSFSVIYTANPFQFNLPHKIFDEFSSHAVFARHFFYKFFFSKNFFLQEFFFSQDFFFGYKNWPKTYAASNRDTINYSSVYLQWLWLKPSLMHGNLFVHAIDSLNTHIHAQCTLGWESNRLWLWWCVFFCRFCWRYHCC